MVKRSQEERFADKIYSIGRKGLSFIEANYEFPCQSAY
jgi:hypothetical protein